MLLDERFIPIGFALDRVGERMFPESWKGFEPTSEDTEDPSQKLAAKAELEAKYERAQEGVKFSAKMIAAATTEESRAEWTAKKAEFFEDRNAVASKLSEISAVNEDMREHYAYSLKTRQAEEKLREGLRGSRLHVFFDHRSGHALSSYEGTPGFELDIRASCAVRPSTSSKPRISMVCLLRAEFERWIAGVYSVEKSTDGKQDPAEFMIARIHQMIDDGERPDSAQGFRDEIRAAFPAMKHKDITAIWRTHAPPSWKRGGRPKTPKN